MLCLRGLDAWLWGIWGCYCSEPSVLKNKWREDLNRVKEFQTGVGQK